MIPVLLGLGVLIGGAIVVANWDAIVGWLRDFIPKLKSAWNSIRENIPHGARMYGDLITKVIDGIERLVSRIMHKLYYQEDGQWVEETTTRIVDESEVPAAIRAKLQKKSTDITDEIEQELHLTV